MDTGQCVMIAAGAPAPAVIPLPLPQVEQAATPKHARPVRRQRPS